ncbi:anthrone oxygenase family protein [Sphingosinicella sp.]|uniref:anthrone oxygenase family protein n=1 Tax=Sphingosinicella sp. TaxID=1917971 RepID=UPI004037B098
MSLIATLIIAAALGSALIGGLFFAFSTFVMRALGERPVAEGMAAMVAINRVILRSLFMPVFFGTALLAAGLGVFGLVRWTPASLWLIGGALAYLVGSIVVTMVWNVPLNNRIDRADPAADNEALWRHYLDRWTLWNHVRTVACLVAAGLFIRALLG